MGQGNSKQLSVHFLKDTLKVKDIRKGVSNCKILEFIEKICSCFPKQGTLDADPWQCIPVKIQQYYDEHGLEKILVDIFNLQTFIQYSLDLHPERLKLLRKSNKSSPSLKELLNEDAFVK